MVGSVLQLLSAQSSEELFQRKNSHKPLSDNKITQVLEEKGINVARRTIAKYRESLSIPPSNERKRLS